GLNFSRFSSIHWFRLIGGCTPDAAGGFGLAGVTVAMRETISWRVHRQWHEISRQGISSCADIELRTDNDSATIFQHSSRAGDVHVNGVRTAIFELRRCRDRKGVPAISITGSRQVLA